jgi:hypothetical protein
MLSTDVYRWLLNRTSLTGVAQEMVIKYVMCMCASVIEALVHDALEGIVGRNARFKTRTNRLDADGVIDDRLHQELDWVWSARDAFHLFLVDHREIGSYTLRDSNRAVRALHDLISALDAAAEANLPF